MENIIHKCQQFCQRSGLDHLLQSDELQAHARLRLRNQFIQFIALINKFMVNLQGIKVNKSTLLRTLNRIYDLYGCQYAEGDILLDGQSIFKNTDVNELRSKVGMVFQKPTPFPMSIYDNMAFGLKNQGRFSKSEIKDRIESALKRAHLWEEVKDKLNADSNGLSGGQQQRLCIARTIALEPEVILMDEPTSALDPIATAAIESLITELREKYTIVIVTHNMQQAVRISDYTGFMYLGELEEFNTTDNIFHHPEKDRTRRYISGDFG